MTRSLMVLTALAALPVTLSAAPGMAQTPGAIFDVDAGYASLHEGLRARRVGDPVTIVLVEQVNASKSVSGKTQKGGRAAITLPKTGPLALLSPDALNLGSDSSFNGQGNAAQTSALSTTLAVTIAEVRPNGTALVNGEKRMLLSQGDEWVRFSGVIRLADIDLDNRVPSNRVADARIDYSGKGALQRASRPGWLSRFFNAISPF